MTRLQGASPASKYPLIRRRMQYLHTRTPIEEQTTISVMQWNILAYGLSADGQGNFETEVLDWNERRKMMLEEIMQRDVDLVAIEEMDDFKHFKEQLSGYDGLFTPKPDSPCLSMPMNLGPDGCAIFYRTDVFKLVSNGSAVLEMSDGSPTNSVAAWVNLEHRTTARKLTLVVTHLKSKAGEEFKIKRQHQAKDLMKLVKQMSFAPDRTIVCGDFNGDPSEDMYATMTKDKDFKLESAYQRALGSEPSWTTKKTREGTGTRQKCIDYVFYTASNLTPLAVLQLPEAEGVPDKGYPSRNFPSDHLDLVVKFAI